MESAVHNIGHMHSRFFVPIQPRPPVRRFAAEGARWVVGRGPSTRCLTKFMPSFRHRSRFGAILRFGFLLPFMLSGLAIPRLEAAPNVTLWDTVVRFTDGINAGNRELWKAVPSDLLSLEADPPKASSDPGYYGRGYSFRGDAVLENRSLAIVFWSAEGKVIVYSKKNERSPAAKSGWGGKLGELLPLAAKGQKGRITEVDIVRNAGDEVTINVSFASSGGASSSSLFSLGRSEILEIKPAPGMKGITLASSIEYAVAPDFIGDDLIFGPVDSAQTGPLAIPAEHMLMALLKGEENALVMTWPEGKQRVSLSLGGEDQGKRRIQAIDFDTDGRSFYLAGWHVPGFWHREELTASYLEKDVAIQWKKPFSAKWKTQLSEAGVRTTFAFREAKAQIWRGVPGMYSYPVWFTGETANYRLSKKVLPKGESLIYFVEGQDTPAEIAAPVDILKASLGRPMTESILDPEGRKLRTHHRRGADGVRRACTCGCTEAIQAIFEAGLEAEKIEIIKAELDDMVYFVQKHIERIDEYRRFADDLTKFLRAQGSSSADLKSYVENLEQIAGQIPQEYNVQKENMKSLDHAHDLVRQTLALTAKKDSKNLAAYMELLKAWRAMGGAQDYIVAQCHTITRKLAQEAGYSAINNPKAAELAQEIRKRCRQCLRNPDGYEIWANY